MSDLKGEFKRIESAARAVYNEEIDLLMDLFDIGNWARMAPSDPRLPAAESIRDAALVRYRSTVVTAWRDRQLALGMEAANAGPDD